MKNIVGVAVGRCQEQLLVISRDVLEVICVFPVLSSRSGHVVRDPLLEEVGPGTVLHGPVVPLLVKIVEVDHGRLSKGQSIEFSAWSTSAGMVPRPNDQVVVLPGRKVPVLHVLTVIGHSSWLISIIDATDNGEDWDGHLCVLLRRRRHRFPKIVITRMGQLRLKGRAGKPGDLFQLSERKVVHKNLTVFPLPKTVVTA